MQILSTIRLLAISLSVTLLALWTINLTWHPTPQSREAITAKYMINMAILQPEDMERTLYGAGVGIFCVCAIFFGLVLKKLRVVSYSESRVVSTAVSFLTASLLLGVAAFCFADSLHLKVFRSLMANPTKSAAFACLFIFLLVYEWRSRYLQRLLYLPLVVLSLTPLPFLVGVVNFDLTNMTDGGCFTDHFNALFDSVAQVYHGKTLLMGSSAQYGLYSHFLEPIFRITGLSVFSFSIGMGILLTVSYVCLFLTLAGTIRRGVLVLLSCWSLLYGALLFLLVDVRDPVFQYAPLRLFFPALLVYTAHRWFRTNQQHWFWISHLIAALAPWWNVDSGLACFLSWYVTLFVRAVTSRSGESIVRRVARIVLPGIGVFFAANMAVILWLRARGGYWPDLKLIIDHHQLSLAGFGLMPMSLVHPWNFVILLYAIGFVYGVERWARGSRSRSAGELLLLSMLGFTLFLYYQGRSHDFNLLHVWWPAWMIGSILFSLVFRDMEARLRLATTLRKPANRGKLAWLTEFGLLDAGKGIFVLSAIVIWSATAPLVIESIRTVTPLLGDTSGVIAHRAKTVRRMIGSGERPLVLSRHSGVLLNELGQQQPVDVAGLGELFAVRDFSRIEKWLDTDPKAVVAVDNITSSQFIWSGRVLDALQPRGFHMRSVSSDCEVTIFDKGAGTGNTAAPNFDASSLFGPSSSAVIVNATACGNRLLTRQPSGRVVIGEHGPISVSIPFTIQFIVKAAPRQGTYAHILGNHPGRRLDGFVVQQNGTQVNRYGFSFGDGSTFAYPLNFSLTPDIWHYVAIVITPAQASVYIDGKLADQASIQGRKLANSLTPFKIGNWIGGDRPFAGHVAAIRIDNASVLPKKYTSVEWQFITETLDKAAGEL